MHGAGGNATGYTHEPAVSWDAAGTEHLGVAATGDQVAVYTVDQLMTQHRIEEIDFLQIDTEGSDDAVLRGANEALAHKRVRIVEFEYHAAWRGRAELPQTLERLRASGYHCFWQVRSGSGLVGASPRCDFQFYHWSNLVCTHSLAIGDTLQRGLRQAACV